jgi:hypothetical protein
MGDIERIPRVGSAYSSFQVHRKNTVDPDQEKKKHDQKDEHEEPHDTVELHLEDDLDSDATKLSLRKKDESSGLDIAV